MTYNFLTSNSSEILEEFIAADAVLRGHFILSSGLHSDTYIQCAKILMNPKISEKLCKNLAQKINEKFGENFADIVVSPAMGGVVVGYEMARQLGLSSIFCERVNGQFELRRGFQIKKNERVLLVEDVITTGKSSLETIELIKKFEGQVVGACSLIDRSGDENLSKKMNIEVISLLSLKVKTFAGDEVPLELRDIPAIKPGSRFLSQNSSN